MILLILCLAYGVFAEEKVSNDAYKDQYCTDPRTMKRHSAYTEWADAYSCTRHRCQPGGRNLAIYTVGCKRVEAPESAIECEEVVEDTNMQFPYCCTRLRCLVVVRGEVWTRVLGQPWETLPAAPWSHMYKMKKPPPGNEFTPKVGNEGPVYELTDSDSEKTREAKVMRATAAKAEPSYDTPRAPQSPDIVIALTTTTNDKELNKPEAADRKRRKPPTMNQYNLDEDIPNEVRDDGEEATEKAENDLKEWRKSQPTESPLPQPLPAQEMSEEKEGRDSHDFRDNREGNAREFANSYSYQNQKPKEQHREFSEVPQAQWNEPEQEMPKEINYRQQDASPPLEDPNKTPVKSTHLQALVDAIGSRMRDIENVVQKMSEKVTVSVKQKPEQNADEGSAERSMAQDSEQHGKYSQERKPKKQNPGGDQYKRFAVRNRGSKYLHAVEGTSEAPVFGGDNGYFSDASNSVLRRSNPGIEPKVEPAATYMAPVENRRKAPSPTQTSEEKLTKKHRRRSHKKKKKSLKTHKRHHKESEKKRKFTRANSVENDKILISLEDSSATA